MQHVDGGIQARLPVVIDVALLRGFVCLPGSEIVEIKQPRERTNFPLSR